MKTIAVFVIALAVPCFSSARPRGGYVPPGGLSVTEQIRLDRARQDARDPALSPEGREIARQRYRDESARMEAERRHREQMARLEELERQIREIELRDQRAHDLRYNRR